MQYLFEKNTLTREEAKQALIEVGMGKHSDVEFASFLTVFKMRPVTSGELAGFRDAMTELCLRPIFQNMKQLMWLVREVTEKTLSISPRWHVLSLPERE